MLGLFKKKKQNCVVKFFKLIEIDDALNFDNKNFISKLLMLLDNLNIGQPTNYYIMGPYPDKGWIQKNAFLKSLEKKDYKNIILLIISNDNFSIQFSNWLPNYEKPPQIGTIDFNIEISKDCIPLDILLEQINYFISEFEFDYGYAFTSTETLGLSELSTRKSFFGGTESKVNPIERKWQNETFKIGNGKVKNVFECNFLSINYHKNILDIISNKTTSEIKEYNSNLKLWKVKKYDITKYRQKIDCFIIA